MIDSKVIKEKVFFEICDKVDYDRMSPLQIRQELSKFIDKNGDKVRGSLELIIEKLSDMYLNHFWSHREYSIFNKLN